MSGYRAASTLSPAGDALDLETALGATPQGLVDHPQLFSGFLARPDVAAAAILAVADVAATRYADFGLAKRLANLDPVVTASGDRLRFESFSACNGVHARFDLLADGIDAGDAAFGTTNVDVNQPLRTALAGVGRASLLHLSVGPQELRVALPDESFVERQVELPDRWVRGFAETPLLAEAVAPVAELRGSAIAKFLGGMPKGGLPGPDLHLAPGPRGLVRRLDAASGGIFLAGSGRLRAAARIARFATRLRVFAAAVGTSAWVFDLPGGRLSLLLSPGSYRGFSGEGSLLTLIAAPEAERVGRRIGAHLAWTPVIDQARLGDRLGLSAEEVARGVAWLAASGRVGFDIADGAWFHRELPIDAEAVLRRNPRLAAAHRLVQAGRLKQSDEQWIVEGDTRRYRISARDGRWVCGCTWEHEHAGTRGPCKHALAVLLAEGSIAPPPE